MTTAGDEAQRHQDNDDDWRARRLRKRVDARRRREKEGPLAVCDDEKKQTRDAARLRALQVVARAKQYFSCRRKKLGAAYLGTEIS